MAHLSRIGFGFNQDGTYSVRSHVIDMHSSPGNSGASVLLTVPEKGGKASLNLFLGVVQGFRGEEDSYLPYEAPVTPTSFELVSADKKSTNKVALAIKTVANPNLTNVTPVHELQNLRIDPNFITAVNLTYEMHKQHSFEVKTTPAPPPAPKQDKLPPAPIPPGFKLN